MATALAFVLVGTMFAFLVLMTSIFRCERRKEMVYVRLARRAAREEKGITGLETAIILIAFVVVATVFAFVVLTTGIFSSERGKETVYAGLAKARGTLEMRGGVIATSAVPPTVDSIILNLATTAGGDAIPLDPAATTSRTVFAYRDATTIERDLAYTVFWTVGDGDNLLEPGELAEVTVVPPAASSLGPNTRFTLEIQSPVGAVIDITRDLPGSITTVMQLH